MPKRAHDHADDRRAPSVSDQLAGTLFDRTAGLVGSQPRAGSEQTADRVIASDGRVSREWQVLERLAQSPVTVDGFVQELREALGDPTIERSSYAPRFTNLMNAGWAAYDDSATVETSMGGVACPYRITDAGRAELRRREALRQERDRERYVNRFAKGKR